MALLGMKNIKYAILQEDDVTYTTVKTMGKAISATVAPNIAEGNLYADDSLAEYQSAFVDATITLGLDDDDDTVFAEILGKTIDTTTGVLSSNIADNPPYIGFGYIVTKVKNGVRKWRAQFFPKVKFSPFIPDANTKNESIEFGTPSVEGKTLANINGVWEQHVEKDSEADAITALTAFFTPTTKNPIATPIITNPTDGETDVIVDVSFKGTGTKGAQVTVFNASGDKRLGTTTVDDDGNFLVKLDSDLSNGVQYTIYATQTVSTFASDKSKTVTFTTVAAK